MSYLEKDLRSERRDPAKPVGTSAPYAVYVLIVLTLVNMMNTIDRVIVNILVEPIRREFGFSDTQIAAIGGLGFALFYGLLGLPIARLADRGNRTRLLAGGLALWSIMTFMTGRAMGFWSMLCARFGVGVGESTCYPTALSLIGDYFTPQRRPLAVSVFQIGLDLGFIIGAPIAGIVATHYGWRTAFTVVGVPGLLLALVLLLSVREPARGTLEGIAAVDRLPPSGVDDRLGGLRRLLIQDRIFPLLAAANVFMALGAATLAMWGAAYMMRSHGLREDQVGALLGPILGLGGFTGTLLGGALGTRIAKRDGRPFAPLKVMLTVILPAALGMVLFVLGPTLLLAMAGGVAGGFLTGMHYGPLIATTISRAAPEDRGLAGSLLLIGQSVVGFGFGPLIVGAISDALAPQLGNEALRYAMLFAPCSVVAAWFCVRAAWVRLDREFAATAT